MGSAKMIALAKMIGGSGGGGGSLGNLTKYEQKKLTFPNAANEKSYDAGAIVPVSFDPVLVVVTGGTDTAGNIICGVYWFNHKSGDLKAAGCTSGRNTSNSYNTSGCNTSYKPVNLPIVADNRCIYYDGKIYITRVSGVLYWSNTDEYTFDIYG